MGLERMAKWPLTVNQVSIAAPVALLVDVAGVRQVTQDALDGALGDSDLVAELSDREIGVARDTQQDVCVVRKEGPADVLRLRVRHDDCAYHETCAPDSGPRATDDHQYRNFISGIT
jgi:hypothetical protein